MKIKEAKKSGFKKTRLGWLPKDWGVVRAKDYIDLLSGFAFKSEGYTNNPGVKLLRGDNIMQGYFRWTGVKYWNKENTQGLDKYFLKENDLVIAMDRTWVSRGLKVAVLSKWNLPCLLVQRVSRLRAKGELEQDLLKYFFSSYRFEQYVKQVQKESAVPHISAKQIKEFLIQYPPLPEQQKIAAILSTWDRAIDLTQQLIAAKEEQKKGLMQRLFQVQDNWKKYTYKQLLKEVKRPIEWNDEEKYDLISVRRRSGGLFHRDSLFGHQIKTKNLRTAKEGDFLISKMQIVHGASGLTTKEFDGMKISGSYIALVSRDSNLLDIEYMNWLSKTPWFYHQTYISSYGVHIEKMTFDFKSFLKQSISLPSLGNQKDTAQKLNLFDKEIKLLNAKAMVLKEQKKGLMQQLLTGKIRVKIN